MRARSSPRLNSIGGDRVRAAGYRLEGRPATLRSRATCCARSGSCSSTAADFGPRRPIASASLGASAGEPSRRQRRARCTTPPKARPARISTRSLAVRISSMLLYPVITMKRSLPAPRRPAHEPPLAKRRRRRRPRAHVARRPGDRADRSAILPSSTPRRTRPSRSKTHWMFYESFPQGRRPGGAAHLRERPRTASA